MSRYNKHRRAKRAKMVRKLKPLIFDPKEIVCFFDGATEPINPGGNMGVGAVIKRGDDILFEYSEYYKADFNNSNNVAEYMAFIAILDWFLDNEMNTFPIRIFGDSMLVIEQIAGHWRINEGRYVPYAIEAKDKFTYFTNCKLKWIPREQNEEADKLSKKCMIENNCEFKIQPL